MPASAGRVKMPDDNRLSVSSSLRTHAIWKECVGYDPYAPRHEARETAAVADEFAAAKEAATRSAAALFALARARGKVALHIPGACRLCGEVGHFSFQCQNMISVTDFVRAEQESTTDDVDEKKLCEELGIAWESSENSSEDEEEDGTVYTPASKSSEPAAAFVTRDSRDSSPARPVCREKNTNMKNKRRAEHRHSKRVTSRRESRHRHHKGKKTSRGKRSRKISDFEGSTWRNQA